MASAGGYDPGVPTLVRLLGDGSYAVPSFRAEAKEYKVVLGEQPSCSCPQHTIRGVVCKHILACESQAKWRTAVERAQRCNDAELRRLGAKYAHNPVICGAILFVRNERRAALAADAALKEIFG